ncbi:hypothetical protein MMC24_007306 [Lignoscripta atroalba]|nr:hypothetical protein [Lignoscripta atroalba]
MLERATGCLKKGGSRLRVPKITLSRRALHSAFWCHGAGDIDLPSWWISLLQVPRRETTVQPQSAGCASSLPPYLHEDGLLEFLYPSKTLALIRRFASRDLPYLKSRVPRTSSRHGSRTYASIAVEAALDTRPETNPSVNSPARKSPISTLDDGLEQPPHVATEVVSKLIDLLHSTEEGKDCELAWQLYQQLQENSARLPLHEVSILLDMLMSSERTCDVERSMQIFDSILINDRRASHYKRAIKTALSLEQLGKAMELHKEAVSRIQGSLGTNDLLRYTVKHQKWHEALEVWDIYWQHKEMYIERPDIWTEVDGLPLPFLMEKALSAADFAIGMIEAKGLAASAKVRKFASQLISRAFSIHGVEFDVLVHQNMFKKLRALVDLTSEDYRLAITQLLSLNTREHSSAAINYYRIMRKSRELVPYRNLLNALCLKFCDIHSVPGIQMILEDYRHHHLYFDKIVYNTVMRELARQGNAEAVHSLFQEFRSHFGDPTSVAICHPLLYVHFRRAEVQRVVENFERISKDFGLSPSPFCWNTVIAAHARVGDVEGALKWYNKLLDTNASVDSRIFETMMNMYASRGDVEAVNELIKESRLKGIKTTTSMIDSLVLCYIGNDDMDEAVRLVQDALDMDLKGSRTRMWNYVLNACALRSDIEKATDIHRQMQQAGVPLDGMTYAALMQCLVVKRQPLAAFKILSVVMPREKVRVTALHYAVVMGGFLATKEFDRAFAVYNRMLKRNIKPVFSTQNVLLKVATKADNMEHVAMGITNEQLKLTRAEELLEQTLANIDPMEIAAKEPLKGVGAQRLDEAYSSTYFEYLIYVYGRAKAFHKVSELYDRYIATAQRLRPAIEVSPPLKMLSAVMVAHIRLGEHEELEKCWYLAVDKAEKLARRSDVSNLSDPGWVLPSRRFILSIPLRYYMRSLAMQGKVDDMSAVIDELHTSGYALDNKAWNLYIQTLACNGREMEAFRLCETELINGWPGWDKSQHIAGIKPRIKALQPTALQLTKRAPNYRTFVTLAAAYIDIRSQSGFADSDLAKLKRDAPRTMEAVTNMPRIDDDLQTNMLRRW